MVEEPFQGRIGKFVKRAFRGSGKLVDSKIWGNIKLLNEGFLGKG
jgi:hypothetical protein